MKIARQFIAGDAKSTHIAESRRDDSFFFRVIECCHSPQRGDGKSTSESWGGRRRSHLSSLRRPSGALPALRLRFLGTKVPSYAPSSLRDLVPYKSSSVQRAQKLNDFDTKGTKHTKGTK